MKINTLRKYPLFILALVSGFAFATGCGDDDNAVPSTTTIEDEDSGASDDSDDTNDESNEADASGTTSPIDTTAEADASDTTGSTAADAGDTTGDEEDAGTGDTDPVVPDDASTDAGPVVEGCVENDEPCFSCPERPEEFLTRCEAPGTQCAAFDNASRLGRYVEGEPLPTP